MDKEFPDQIQTTTTTTTSGADAYQTTPNRGGFFGNIDRAYPRSRLGILNIAKIIGSFFYWVILAAADWWDLGFMITVGISAMIQTGIYFTVFLFHVNEKIQFIAWELSEFILNCVVTCLYLLSAILTSVEAGQSRGYKAHGQLVFCTILAWVLTVMYAFSVFLTYHTCTAFRQRRGRQTTSSSTTTTTTVMVVENNQQYPANTQQYPAVDPYGPPAYAP